MGCCSVLSALSPFAMLFENEERTTMKKRLMSLTSILVLVVGLVGFAGSALAGNGHGNGNGNADAGAASATATQNHGNSAEAHAKKDSASTQADSGGSADQNAGAEAGAKPTNRTAQGNKPTLCTTGGGTGTSATCTSAGVNAATAQTAAKADSSKRYGNGTTAAQIANSRGAPAGTEVYGPGNSQPHKVACPGSDKFVDVHAVKSYSAAGCATQTTTTTANSPTISGTPGKPGTTRAPGTSGTPGIAGTPAGTPAQGGVLGETASAGNPAPAGGVLGAIESVGQGTLPFTGFPLWAIVMLASMLILLGLALRRGGRATV